MTFRFAARGAPATAVITVLTLLAAMTVLGVGRRPASGASTGLPPSFVEEVVATGLTHPTAIAWLPDGRLVVAEKEGVIRIVKNGEVLPTPFADLRTQVSSYWDRGLTGIAVDPAFASNHYVYLFYPYDLDGSDGAVPTTSRLTRVTADGDVMLPGSERVILGSVTGRGCPPKAQDCMPVDYWGHAADTLKFASDGSLFASHGDGASWDEIDPRSFRSQDLDAYSGKLLRINTEGKGLPSNPFWNGDPDAVRSKVWAYGFRNPFRFTLDPVTGTPLVGDVGSLRFEEIGLAPAGANRRWPCLEGGTRVSGFDVTPACLEMYGSGIASSWKSLVVWNRECCPVAAIIAGPFTPESSPYPTRWHRGFFYAEYAQAWIRFQKLDAQGNVAGSSVTFAEGAGGPVQLEFGPDGSLYSVALFDGEVRRYTYRDPLQNTSPVAPGVPLQQGRQSNPLLVILGGTAVMVALVVTVLFGVRARRG